jgi:hypothetical protein
MEEQQKITEAHDKMTEAYEEWKKCQNLPRRPGYAEECKESYNEFSKLLQEYNAVIYSSKDGLISRINNLEDDEYGSKREKIPKFPETVIVALMIHGTYDVNFEKDGIEYFDLPPGITLRTVSVAPMGVCNFVDPESIDKNLQELIDEDIEVTVPLLNACKKTDSCDEMLDWLTERIANYLRNNENKNFFNDIKKQAIMLSNKDALTAEEYTRVNDGDMFSTYRRDSMYRTNKYTDSAKVPFKSFSVTEKDLLGKKGKHDWEIKIINMPHTPNLLDDEWFDLKKEKFIHPTEGKMVEVKMTDIINYLSAYGAKNIIFIDFSCSNFNNELTPATKSAVIFNTEQNHTIKNRRLGGRKKTRRNNTRRGKTRRLKPKNKLIRSSLRR